jgi:hypothetical protein
MLVDPNVHDIILGFEGCSSVYPPDNCALQPLFGKPIHAFFLKDIQDCAEVEMVCIYEGK